MGDRDVLYCFKWCMAPQYVHKIFDIARNMETDKVAEQQASDNILAPRDDIENIGGRKSCMVEKSNTQIRSKGFEVCGHHPQVILVYPNERPLIRLFGYALCKNTVDLQIMVPVIVIEFGSVHKGENSWPKGLFGKDSIELVNILFRK